MDTEENMEMDIDLGIIAEQREKMEKISAMEPGDIIREALKERYMLQVDLADKLGILQSAVSANINRRKMGLDIFSTMLNVMEYDVAVVDRTTGEVMWKVGKD